MKSHGFCVRSPRAPKAIRCDFFGTKILHKPLGTKPHFAVNALAAFEFLFAVSEFFTVNS